MNNRSDPGVIPTPIHSRLIAARKGCALYLGSRQLQGMRVLWSKGAAIARQLRDKLAANPLFCGFSDSIDRD